MPWPHPAPVVLVDGVELPSSLTIDPTTVNHALNPSFEVFDAGAGAPESWTPGASVEHLGAFGTNPVHGDTVIRAETTFAQLNPVDLLRMDTVRMDLVPGEHVTASIYARRAAADGPGVSLRVEFFDEFGTLLSSSPPSAASFTGTEWTRVVNTGTVPAGACCVAIATSWTPAFGTKVIYLDAAMLNHGDTAADFTDNITGHVLAGLSVQWERPDYIDHPTPATCLFDYLAPAPSDQFMRMLTPGARVAVRQDLGAASPWVFNGTVSDVTMTLNAATGQTSVSVAAVDDLALWAERYFGSPAWSVTSAANRWTSLHNLVFGLGGSNPPTGRDASGDVRPLDVDNRPVLDVLRLTAMAAWNVVDAYGDPAAAEPGDDVPRAVLLPTRIEDNSAQVWALSSAEIPTDTVTVALTPLDAYNGLTVEYWDNAKDDYTAAGAANHPGRRANRSKRVRTDRNDTNQPQATDTVFYTQATLGEAASTHLQFHVRDLAAAPTDTDTLARIFDRTARTAAWVKLSGVPAWVAGRRRTVPDEFHAPVLGAALRWDGTGWTADVMTGPSQTDDRGISPF